MAEDTVGNAINVLANDSDGPDGGETLTVTAVSDPAQRQRASPAAAPA